MRLSKHAHPLGEACLSEESRPRLSEEKLQLDRQAEEVREGLRHTEELDRDSASSAGACITRPSLGKRETVMCPLCTREDERRWDGRRLGLLER
jgi:hypothetical protein